MSIKVDFKKHAEDIGHSFMEGLKEGLGFDKNALDLSPEDFYNNPKLLYDLDMRTAILVDFSMNKLYSDWTDKKKEYNIKLRKVT